MVRWVVIAGLLVIVSVIPTTVTAGSGGNEAPLADAGLDQQVDLGATVLLDATGSRDPDGDLETYDWRIETPDGATIVPRCPTCGETRFHPGEPGTYAVTVTVTDDGGVDSTDTLYVTVAGQSSDQSSTVATPSQQPTERHSPPPAATSLNPPGPDPQSDTSTDCVDPSCDSPTDTAPWLEILGPSSTAQGESVPFALDYGGFDSEPQFGWSIGASGTSGDETWRSPGDETVYVTAAAGSQTARDSHGIEIVENKKPNVDIQTPDNIYPGQTIELTADISDPDGTIQSSNWIGGPQVTVPSNNDVKKVSIEVTDDDEATSVDNIIIRNAEINSNSEEDGARYTVHCYFDRTSERKRQAPDHCEMKNSDNSNDGDGLQSHTGNIDRLLDSSHYDVVWKKVDEDVTRHSDLNDSVGSERPDVEDNDGTSPSIPTLSDAQRDAIRGNSVDVRSKSFSMNGKTVTNDLDGDGEINAADWDERFGSADPDVDQAHRDAVAEAKDARRATDRAFGSGGPSTSGGGSSNSGSSAGGTTSSASTSSSSSTGSSTGDSGTGSASSGLGWSPPDSISSSDSNAAHVAEKSREIARNGLDLGGGMF